MSKPYDSDIAVVLASDPTLSVHPPWFITRPGELDTLLLAMGALLVLLLLAFGVLMLRLHHLPEHVAQKQQKVQYEVVAVLGLLAMFTHQNLFWIAALLLAMIDLPDFGPVLSRIARSVERIALTKRRESDASNDTTTREIS